MPFDTPGTVNHNQSRCVKPAYALKVRHVPSCAQNLAPRRLDVGFVVHGAGSSRTVWTWFSSGWLLGTLARSLPSRLGRLGRACHHRGGLAGCDHLQAGIRPVASSSGGLATGGDLCPVQSGGCDLCLSVRATPACGGSTGGLLLRHQRAVLSASAHLQRGVAAHVTSSFKAILST